jgi:hypothetical protein
LNSVRTELGIIGLQARLSRDRTEPVALTSADFQGGDVSSRARKLTPADEMRLFAGLAVQPFVAMGLTLVAYPLLVIAPGNYHLGGNVTPAQHMFAVAIYFGMAAVCITVACAFPTVVWLVKRRPVPLTLALVFGLAFSNVPVLLAAAGGGGGTQLHVFASLLGLSGAAAFWFISIRGRDFSRDPEVGRS